MTIEKVLQTMKELLPSAISDEMLIRWLSALDGKIKIEIIDTHEGGENVVFHGYDEVIDRSTELLVSAPYDEMYRHWLTAQVHYANEEIERYNAAAELFNRDYDAYEAWYNRTHRPIAPAGWRW